MTQRIGVIGGGAAGLATAALLAREGHTVDLFEQNSTLGGRIGSIERDGYRFDTGPSWYLMPEVYEHFFNLVGTSASCRIGSAQSRPGLHRIQPRFDILTSADDHDSAGQSPSARGLRTRREGQRPFSEPISGIGRPHQEHGDRLLSLQSLHLTDIDASARDHDRAPDLGSSARHIA